MTDEKDHAGPRHTPAPEPPKSPSSLPGPNRFPDTARYGEALAPGTIPEDEKKEREETERVEKKPAGGVDRP